MEWWIWLLVGLGLVAAEVVLPLFVLVWFGVSAVGVAFISSMIPLSLTAQFLAWTIVSVLLTGVWFRLFQVKRHVSRVGLSDQAVGEIGVLVREVGPYQRSDVRFQRPVLGSDVWACVADETIAAGERVRVVAVEGQLVRVVAAAAFTRGTQT